MNIINTQNQTELETLLAKIAGTNLQGFSDAGLEEGTTYTFKGIVLNKPFTVNGEERTRDGFLFVDQDGVERIIKMASILNLSLLKEKDEKGQLVARQTDWFKHMNKFSGPSLKSKEAFEALLKLEGRKYKVSRACKTERKFIANEPTTRNGVEYLAGEEVTYQVTYYVMDSVK